jgi:hypothetical protein
MSARRLLLTLLACVVGVCALSAPAALAGAPASGQGVVLSLGGHTVRLVDKAHRVGGVRMSSTRGLRRGDVVRVRRGKAHVTAHARRLSFLGRVVRSSRRGAVVRLTDGSTFKFSGSRKPHRRGARAARNLAADLQGLTPGQTLLITLATDAHGNVAIAIRVMPSGNDTGEDGGDQSGDGDWASCDDDTADEGDCGEDEAVDEVDGAVTALADDGSSLTLAPDDGSAEETYPVDDPSLLDGIEVGAEVAVTLDEDGTAIDVELLDWADDDPGPGDDDDGGDDDL